MRHATYSRYSNARKLAERLQKAYPDKCFCPVQDSMLFTTWNVALMEQDKVRALCAKPRKPLPGEPGHVPVKTCKYNVEYTDTFCGEANYSWVDRKIITVPENWPLHRIMREAKASVGITGLKGRSYWEGDMSAEFRPRGLCTVLFVHWHEG
jgi:hypothetical protein